MERIANRFYSLEDFLISKELTVDGISHDADGVPFPVKGREIQATVVFADMTGFSRRTLGLSSTETLAFVNHFFTWITTEAAGMGPGIVDKYIGDEVMIVFSNEFGSEDSFTDALRTGIRLAERDPVDFRPHIGIASGLVTVGYVGTPVKYDCSVFGKPVTLAARCAAISPQDSSSPSIFFPAECWGKRRFEEVVITPPGERCRWEMLSPRRQRLPNMGETDVIEVSRLTSCHPLNFSAEDWAKQDVKNMQISGKYRPLTEGIEPPKNDRVP